MDLSLSSLPTVRRSQCLPTAKQIYGNVTASSIPQDPTSKTHDETREFNRDRAFSLIVRNHAEPRLVSTTPRGSRGRPQSTGKSLTDLVLRTSQVACSGIFTRTHSSATNECNEPALVITYLCMAYRASHPGYDLFHYVRVDSLCVDLDCIGYRLGALVYVVYLHLLLRSVYLHAYNFGDKPKSSLFSHKYTRVPTCRCCRARLDSRVNTKSSSFLPLDIQNQSKYRGFRQYIQIFLRSAQRAKHGFLPAMRLKL